MNAIPAHLIDLARLADRTPTRVRPEQASRVAALILSLLPPEDPATCLGRLAQLDAAINPRKDAH